MDAAGASFARMLGPWRFLKPRPDAIRARFLLTFDCASLAPKRTPNILTATKHPTRLTRMRKSTTPTDTDRASHHPSVWLPSDGSSHLGYAAKVMAAHSVRKIAKRDAISRPWSRLSCCASLLKGRTVAVRTMTSTTSINVSWTCMGPMADPKTPIMARTILRSATVPSHLNQKNAARKKTKRTT